MGSTQYRGMGVLLALIAGGIALGGCASAPAHTEASPAPPVATAPATQVAAPPPDTGGASGVPLTLASLPIGGAFEDAAAQNCVVVNWIPKHPEHRLPQGVKVTVTGAGFDPEVYDPVDSGCSGTQPSCFGFSFEAGHTACGLGVRPTGIRDVSPGGQTSLTVSGEVVCDDPASSVCTAFFTQTQADGGSTIQLDAPSPPGNSTP